MDLIADRFALDERGRAVDLATGARVTLIVEPAGDVSQQLQWSERCETLHTLRHPAIASLVDFGLTGPASRFEAWACDGAWRGSPDVARSVCARARRVLRAACLSIGAAADDLAYTRRDGAGIFLPDAGSGYPSAAADAPDAALPLTEHGIRLIDRPAVAALAEVVRTQSGSRSPIVSLFGARESGLTCAVDAIARAARLTGFIPVAAPLLDSPAGPLWNGRSLLVIAADPAPPTWSAFVRTSLRIAQPHMLLIAADAECRAVDGVPLRGVSPDALVDAVRPRVVGGPHEAAVRAAAEHAHGLPGRFARRIWRRARGASASDWDRAPHDDRRRAAGRVRCRRCRARSHAGCGGRLRVARAGRACRAAPPHRDRAHPARCRPSCAGHARAAPGDCRACAPRRLDRRGRGAASISRRRCCGAAVRPTHTS